MIVGHSSEKLMVRYKISKTELFVKYSLDKKQFFKKSYEVTDSKDVAVSVNKAISHINY